MWSIICYQVSILNIHISLQYKSLKKLQIFGGKNGIAIIEITIKCRLYYFKLIPQKNIFSFIFYCEANNDPLNLSISFLQLPAGKKSCHVWEQALTFWGLCPGGPLSYPHCLAFCNVDTSWPWHAYYPLLSFHCALNDFACVPMQILQKKETN